MFLVGKRVKERSQEVFEFRHGIDTCGYFLKLAISSISISQRIIEICTIWHQSIHIRIVLHGYDVYTRYTSQMNTFQHIRFPNWLGRNLSSSWMQAWKFKNIVNDFDNVGSFNQAKFLMAGQHIHCRRYVQFLVEVINALKS